MKTTKNKWALFLSVFCILAAMCGCGGDEGRVESTAILNFPPAALTGPDRSVLPGDEVFLDGSRSSDPNGDPLFFFWRFLTRPDGSSAVLTDPMSVTPSFIADERGSYIVELTVNNGRSEDTDIVTIRAADPEENLPPVADAGPDRTVQVGVPLTIDARQSFDPEGDPLNFATELISSPPDSLAVVSGPDTSTPFLVPDVVGDFVLDVTVSDSLGARGTDRLVFTAVPGEPPPAGNLAPEADAGPDRIMSVGTRVTMDGQASFDPDGDDLFFFWNLIEKPALSETALLDPTSPIVTFQADVEGEYRVRLLVSDGFETSSPDMTIVVASRNPPDGMGLYDSLCSRCHSLGLHDPLGAPELSGQADLMPQVFQPVHKEIVLTDEEILAIRQFINFQ